MSNRKLTKACRKIIARWHNTKDCAPMPAPEVMTRKEMKRFMKQNS